MTELERLLTEQLQRLSEQHEQQVRQLLGVQQMHSRSLAELSERVATLTALLQS